MKLNKHLAEKSNLGSSVSEKMHIQVDFYQIAARKNDQSINDQVCTIEHYFFNFKLVLFIKICLYSKRELFFFLP